MMATKRMLDRWIAYANSRGQARVGAHDKPVSRAAFSDRGWWKRWTRNLDALETRLNPRAAVTRARFRRKQSAKAILERDARRSQKRGEGPDDADLD